MTMDFSVERSLAADPSTAGLQARSETHPADATNANDAHQPGVGGQIWAVDRIDAAVRRQAMRSPEVQAVVWKGTALTYGELEVRSNRLAHYLRRLGVGPDVRVAVMLQRTPSLIVALLAILKAGGAMCRSIPATLPIACPSCWPTARRAGS
ncbi:MAG TPA: AMP-binding protein [Acetobacteraceae bacterium]|nr:AMP-binding protein [Acetobacteraceae bacterium]